MDLPLNNEENPQAVTQPVSLPPEPKRKPPFFLWLIGGLLLGIIIGEGILYFRSSGLSKKAKPQEAKTEAGQKFIPTEAQPQSSDIKDFFNWPGWLVSGVEISQDGGSIIISGLQEANWLLVKNDDPSSWPKVVGDFEISFSIKTELFPEVNNNSSVVIKIENQPADSSKTNYLQLTYYSASSEVSFETSINSNYIKLGRSLLPEPKKLKLQFKNIGSDKPETLTVFDNQTGQQIFEKQFSDVLFDNNSFFGLSFDLEKGIKSLTISDLVLTGLEKTI
ncbi:MAG: hypothetical protein ABH867_03725 [Patescibacteria group bacterium]|nr:hypothetical protein [Patescibacteria group bacterium]